MCLACAVNYRRGIGDLKIYVGLRTSRLSLDQVSTATSTDIAVNITYSKHDPARHVGIISSQVATKVYRSYNSVFLYP